MVRFVSSTVCLLVCFGLCLGQVQDQTRVDGASGSEVVEAVVSRIRDSCVFPDFKLFLRRLAFVETQDGLDSSTYRSGYNGGIWQIDESTFDSIRSSSKAQSLLSAINSKFAINWNNVQWSDLRKPLYSGLAAALYLTTLSMEIPRNTENQAPYYKNHFRNRPDAAHTYITKVKTMNTVCQHSNLDLAFIVDGSSSLSISDFRNAKRFAHSVVSNFNIGTNDIRVSFVTFSVGYTSHFDFRQYTDKSSLLSAIDSIQKPEGQTDTDKALTFAADRLFTAAHGARAGASKVILLLTDGDSTNPDLTTAAALKAQSDGILVFAIGVGDGLRTDELNHVASQPQCTHVIKLAGYNDLSALVNQIQEVSCKAAAVLNLGTYTFPCAQGGLFQIVTNNSETQVTITNTDGKVEIYGSITNPNPTKAVNSFYSSATAHISSRDAAILILHESNPVYFTIASAASPNECTGSFTIKVGNIERVKPDTHVTCVDMDHVRGCSVVSIYNRLYSLLPRPYNINNFCSSGSPNWYPHPTDQTKYVFCSNNGTMYVFQCSMHHVYNPSRQMCVAGEPSTTSMPTTTTTTTVRMISTTHRTPPSHPTGNPLSNPCTAENIANHHFFFPYYRDATKYIDCSNWPTWGWIKSCPSGKVWDQRDLTCTYAHVVIDPTNQVWANLPNPCVNPLRQGDLFYYPHPTDKHKYIQCDQYGDAFVLTCSNARVWNERLLQCVPENLLIGLPNVTPPHA